MKGFDFIKVSAMTAAIVIGYGHERKTDVSFNAARDGNELKTYRIFDFMTAGETAENAVFFNSGR